MRGIDSRTSLATFKNNIKSCRVLPCLLQGEATRLGSNVEHFVRLPSTLRA
jgi:hypothetical protein